MRVTNFLGALLKRRAFGGLEDLKPPDLLGRAGGSARGGGGGGFRSQSIPPHDRLFVSSNWKDTVRSRVISSSVRPPFADRGVPNQRCGDRGKRRLPIRSKPFSGRLPQHPLPLMGPSENDASSARRRERCPVPFPVPSGRTPLRPPWPGIFSRADSAARTAEARRKTAVGSDAVGFASRLCIESPISATKCRSFSFPRSTRTLWWIVKVQRGWKRRPGARFIHGNCSLGAVAKSPVSDSPKFRAATPSSSSNSRFGSRFGSSTGLSYQASRAPSVRLCDRTISPSRHGFTFRPD